MHLIRKRQELFSAIMIFTAFIIFLFLNPKLLNYRFDEETKVRNYLRSQDILDAEDRIKDRITISDSDIYEASGYLYAEGAEPTDYNFQHPPFAKYLFGFSIKLFGNPYIVQIVFGSLFLLGIFVLGSLVFKNSLVGLLGSLGILTDPVFKEVTLYTLLDLSQITFFIWFLIVYLFYPKRWYISGILLGFSIASKFYSPIIFYLVLIFLWKRSFRKYKDIREIGVVGIAILAFAVTYVVSFIREGGLFNIIFWQGKIIKFMLHHDVAGVWGRVIPMFFGGYIFWPVAFGVSLLMLLKYLKSIKLLKRIESLIYLLPLAYLFLLTFQKPFERYFILILPFFYLGVSNFVLKITRLKVK